MTIASEQHVPFGKTDLIVSRLCQGTAFRTIGREADNPRGEAVIHHCLGVGINFFDSAMGYGLGGAEQALGKALQGRRHEVVICTKVGPGHLPKREGEPGRPATFTRQFLHEQLEGSLKRLGTDYLDLYLLHKPDDHTPPAEVAEAMDALVAAGKIRYWGVSNFSAAQVGEYLQLAEDAPGSTIAGIEEYFNIAGDEALKPGNDESRMTVLQRQMFPLLDRFGIGMLAFSPMDTGNLAPRREVAPDSPIVELIGVIDQVAAELDVARATVCVAWVMAHRQVTCCLAGCESTQHVDENLAGLQLELPATALAKLNEANKTYRAHWADKASNP